MHVILSALNASGVCIIYLNVVLEYIPLLIYCRSRDVKNSFGSCENPAKQVLR